MPGSCSQCRSTINIGARICPYCGSKQDLDGRVIWAMIKWVGIIIIGVSIYKYFNPDKFPKEVDGESSYTNSDTASSFDTERKVTDTGLRDDQKPEVASLPQQEVSPNEEMPDHGQAKAPDKPVLSPDMIDNAMKEAFETGKTVRIESNGIKGYAVPSEPQTESRCRSIEFTIDGNDQASRSKAICP